MKKEIDRLQGTWSISSLELDGRPMPAMGTIVVKGSRFTTSAMGEDYSGTISVDGNKTPNTFDLKFTSGPEKGNTNYGIYELDGDTWKICLSITGKDRPTDFASQPGSGHALEILQREKPGKKKKAAAAGKTAAGKAARGRQSDVAPADETAPELGGEWAMASCVINGQALDAGVLRFGKRVAKRNEVTVFMAGRALMKARFSVDRKKSPTTIDYVLLLPPNEGKSQLGIYELEGDTLKTCFSTPGQGRPGDFQSVPGDGRTSTVWKLVKK
ncbi:MAG TPA: TIGR03067 domain-containing protein [Candidatus Acidoferrales bacterium]|nr:TIGR03067 domain-containing protein [Candidatus Acidoferrales bacterium]